MRDESVGFKSARLLGKDLKLSFLLYSDRGARIFVSNSQARDIPSQQIFDGTYQYDGTIQYDGGGTQIIDFQPLVMDWGTMSEYLSSIDPISGFTEKRLRSYSITLQNRRGYWSRLIDRERVLNRYAELKGNYLGLTQANEITFLKMKVVGVALTVEKCTLELSER